MDTQNSRPGPRAAGNIIVLAAVAIRSKAPAKTSSAAPEKIPMTQRKNQITPAAHGVPPPQRGQSGRALRCAPSPNLSRHGRDDNAPIAAKFHSAARHSPGGRACHKRNPPENAEGSRPQTAGPRRRPAPYWRPRVRQLCPVDHHRQPSRLQIMRWGQPFFVPFAARHLVWATRLGPVVHRVDKPAAFPRGCSVPRLTMCLRRPRAWYRAVYSLRRRRAQA